MLRRCRRFAFTISAVVGLEKIVSLNESIEVEDEEDAEWERKKKECSFCKMFLESPCRQQFKYWSKCVDRAKEEGVDFKEACYDVSQNLFQCTSEHHDYFAALNEAMEEEGPSDAEEEDAEDEEETVEESGK